MFANKARQFTQLTIFVSLLLGIFYLLLPSFAHAQVSTSTPRLEQLEKVIESGSTPGGWGLTTQKLACADLSGYISEITLSLRGFSTGNTRIGILDAVYSNGQYPTPLAVSDLVTVTNHQDYTFTFPSPVNVSEVCPNPDGAIYIGLSGQSIVWGSSDHNAYRDETYAAKRATSPTDTVKDWYFIVNPNAISNTAPTLTSIGNQTVSEGDTLQFTVSATDPDGGTLTYTMANAPTGASLDPVTGVFTWNTGYDDAGNYPDVEFTVMDDGEPMMLDVELVTITVGDVNRAPVITNPGPQEVLEDKPLSFTVSATDPDGDSVTLTASNTPSGATFDGTTFSWTPDLTQEGVYTVMFIADDDGTPSESSIIEVVITVGDNPTPTEQAEDLVDDVITIDIPQNVENSYLANLQKVEQFIIDGKIQAALNQLNAFINKLGQDYAQGLITEDDYNDLLAAANNLLADLTGN